MLRLSVNRALSCKGLQSILRRHIGSSAFVLQKASQSNSGMDPIQKMFLDKVREYQTKSKKLGEGKLVDASPEFEQKVAKETEGLKRRFGSENLEEFPKFDFLK